MKSRVTVRWLAGLVALACASTTWAQFPGEFVYGPSTHFEWPGKRVISVTTCADGLGGFITAGASGPFNPAMDVYVVRVLPNGHRLWEYTYDVSGEDAGTSIAELRDGSGFVVTGWTKGSTRDREALLLKIDCDGNVVWATQFVGTAAQETATDVIEARTGTPALGTASGDLVVSGSIGGPGPDGFLIRINAEGTVIWNRRYSYKNTAPVVRELQFNALIEARPTTTPTGDIVTVGYATLPGGGPPRALSLRVSGDDGLFKTPLHCAAARGTPWASSGFYSVIELTRPPLRGSLVMVGSASPGRHPSPDLYLVRTGPFPCAGGSVQRRAGDFADASLFEEALDVREVLTPLPIAPAGSLVVTGRAQTPGALLFGDAFLHIAQASSLKLRAGAGRIYGAQGARFESGSGVATFGNGFVVAGGSSSDFEGNGDHSDLYLVGTDGEGKTGCERPWNPRHIAIDLPVSRLKLTALPFVQQVFLPVVRTERITEYQCCR